jgi:hypothetical protein
MSNNANPLPAIFSSKIANSPYTINRVTMSQVTLMNSTFERGSAFFELEAKIIDISNMGVNTIG